MTPNDEYAAARQGAALIELLERGVLAATGPQRQKFLHSILSNAIEGLKPGQGCLAALLDVKGHLTALMRALVTPDAVLLEMPARLIERVEKTLVFYRVAAPVRFETRRVAVLALLGPQAGATLAAAGVTKQDLTPNAHAEASVAGHGVRLARAGDLPASGYVMHVAPEARDAVADALRAAGAVSVSAATLDVLRIEDGRPWFPPDLGEENLLHETGLLREYHSSTKGCYLGQEVVARLEGRGGHVNKQIRGLRLSDATEAGALVMQDGRELGHVTTAGISPRLGPIALAFVHRSAFEAGTAVEVGGRPATVVRLPFDQPG